MIDEANTPVPFSDLRFSNDGKWMLGMVEGKIYVMDAFNGAVIRRCVPVALSSQVPVATDWVTARETARPLSVGSLK